MSPRRRRSEEVVEEVVSDEPVVEEEVVEEVVVEEVVSVPVTDSRFVGRLEGTPRKGGSFN